FADRAERGLDRVAVPLRAHLRGRHHLDAVARREEHHLAELRSRREAREHLRERVRGEREFLAHVDRRGAVREPDDDDHRACIATTAAAGGALRRRYKMRTRTAKPKPAIDPYGARRPRHPAAARSSSTLAKRS